MALISQTRAWQDLQAHQTQFSSSLRELFAADPQRFQQFSKTACGITFDFSKNHLTPDTLKLLTALLETAEFTSLRQQFFSGGKINHTENRAALHIALRNQSNTPILVDGKDVMPEVNGVLAKMRAFTAAVQSGQWRGHTGKVIDTIVNIGIGGSDLGPAMVTRALRAYHHPRLRAFFVSNVDSTHLSETLQQLNSETTLFVIASKTFTTQETMLNANSARQWFLQQTNNNETAIAQHFVALSTNTAKVTAFGINPDNMFVFWDWVGGRFSLWSAIGLPVMLMIGAEKFDELLGGAHAMDEHFYNAPLQDNLPVLIALVGVWYSSFWRAATQAVLPYDFALELLPAYLQQLEMESLGKRVTRDGENVDYPTCPIIWGAAGNNGQHAFYQLLHQGTHLVPTDFIVAKNSQQPLENHQVATLSNAFAQSLVLMQGRTAIETAAALTTSGMNDEAVTFHTPHRVFTGNQPSNTLIYEKLTPAILGALLALYEHKVFVQSVCWQLNPFDQWGVELGKQVANSLLTALEGGKSDLYDSSTQGLINYCLK